MGVVLLILLVAIVLGVLGIIVKGLLWLFFIALVLALVGFAMGYFRRKSSTTR